MERKLQTSSRLVNPTDRPAHLGTVGVPASSTVALPSHSLPTTASCDSSRKIDRNADKQPVGEGERGGQYAHQTPEPVRVARHQEVGGSACGCVWVIPNGTGTVVLLRSKDQPRKPVVLTRGDIKL